MHTQSITNRATRSPSDDGHTAAQPIVDASTVAAIVTADTAKRDATKAAQAAKRTANKPTVKASKQSGKQSAAKLATPKPSTAAKPVNAADEKQRAERAKLVGDARTFVARFYPGASLAVHTKRALTRASYAEAAQTMPQRANSESVRDASGLAYIASISKAGAFDPCHGAGLDRGIISRLASLKLIAYDPKADAFTITPTGITRARAIVKRAA